MTSPDVVRRRFLQVGLLAPIPIVLLGVVAQLIASPHLPDPVAVHWGISGQPDGFGPAWTYPLFTILLGLGLPALMVGVSLIGSRTESLGGSSRFMGAFSLAIAVFMTVLPTGLLLMQVGVTDAASGPPVWLPLIAALAGAVVAGVAGWYAQPESAPGRQRGDTVAPLPLAPGEQAVWMRTATMSPGAMVFLAAAVVLVLGLGLWILIDGAVDGGGWAGWITIGTGVLLVLLVASTTTFHITVDASGLAVRSSLGIPRVVVPVADIETVGVVVVNPMADFGGWGMRWAPSGRFGVVLRAGEAIEVTRTGGRRFAVTVDDAATGAALLQVFVSRAASRDSAS